MAVLRPSARAMLAHGGCDDSRGISAVFCHCNELFKLLICFGVLYERIRETHKRFVEAKTPVLTYW